MNTTTTNNPTKGPFDSYYYPYDDFFSVVNHFQIENSPDDFSIENKTNSLSNSIPSITNPYKRNFEQMNSRATLYKAETKINKFNPAIHLYPNPTIQQELKKKHENLSNGNAYQGDLLYGKPHGKGKLNYPNGVSYEGDFFNGVPHGRGNLKNSSGNYTGDIVNGKIYGKGTSIFKDGSTYTGSFANGKMHGSGHFTHINGDKYLGDFVNGLRHGHGELIYSNGNIYEGNFINGLRHGKGKFTFMDNGIRKIYEGEFKCGLFDASESSVSLEPNILGDPSTFSNY